MVAPAGEFKPRTSAKVRFEFAMNIYSEPAAPATETTTDSTAPQAQSWRDTLPIHPAAVALSARWHQPARRGPSRTRSSRSGGPASISIANPVVNRLTAKLVNASFTTVEATGDVSKLDTSADTRGRRQPVHKARATAPQARLSERAVAVKTGVANLATERTAAPSESSATVAARDDIGPDSAGERARLNARIDELQAEKRQLEIKAVGLRSEIDELDGWVEDLYGELEAILDRRNGIREQVARLKLEETQA